MKQTTTLFLLLLSRMLLPAQGGETHHPRRTIEFGNRLSWQYSDEAGIPATLNPYFAYSRVVGKRQNTTVGIVADVAYNGYHRNLSPSYAYAPSDVLRFSRLLLTATGRLGKVHTHNRHGICYGIQASYRYRWDEMMFKPEGWWDYTKDPNQHHQDIGIGAYAFYAYRFSKRWSIAATVNAQFYYKIPYSKKYLAEEFLYHKYSAPHILGLGIGFVRELK